MTGISESFEREWELGGSAAKLPFHQYI